MTLIFGQRQGATAAEDVDEFRDLVDAYLALRGKGLSLSAADLEILYHWRSLRLAPDLILDVLQQIADDCAKRNCAFPTSLLPVAQKLSHRLQRLHEY